MSQNYLYNILNVPAVRGAKYGFEVEVENLITNEDFDARDYTEDDSYMYPTLSNDVVTCVQDGSLRDRGGEFIFAKPLGDQSVHKAFEFIEQVCSERGAVSSPRTSTHVHVNVSDMTVQELEKFLYISLCFEPVLMKLVTTHRRNNRFCVPADSSTVSATMRHLMVALESGNRSTAYDCAERTKYAAISLYRLCDLGTVEFRMFDAAKTVEDLSTIHRIVRTLRRLSMNKSLQELKDAKVQGTLLSVLGHGIRSQFGDFSDEEFLSLYEQGARNANDFLINFYNLHHKVREHEKKAQNLHSELEQREECTSTEPSTESSSGPSVESTWRSYTETIRQLQRTRSESRQYIVPDTASAFVETRAEPVDTERSEEQARVPRDTDWF